MCTGESSIPWQSEEGVYTKQCPVALIQQNEEFIAIWQRWQMFGNWNSGGALDQPDVWVQITEILQGEKNRHSKRQSAVKDLRLERQ